MILLRNYWKHDKQMLQLVRFVFVWLLDWIVDTNRTRSINDESTRIYDFITKYDSRTMTRCYERWTRMDDNTTRLCRAPIIEIYRSITSLATELTRICYAIIYCTTRMTIQFSTVDFLALLSFSVSIPPNLLNTTKVFSTTIISFATVRALTAIIVTKLYARIVRFVALLPGRRDRRCYCVTCYEQWENVPTVLFCLYRSIAILYSFVYYLVSMQFHFVLALFRCYVCSKPVLEISRRKWDSIGSDRS